MPEKASELSDAPSSVPEVASLLWSPRFHPCPPLEAPSIPEVGRGVNKKEIEGEDSGVASLGPRRDIVTARAAPCEEANRGSVGLQDLTPSA